MDICIFFCNFAAQIGILMREPIKNLNVSEVSHHLAPSHFVHVGDYGITLQGTQQYSSAVRNGELLQAAEGRIIVVLNGSADCMVNLRDYHLTSGSVLVILPHSLVSLTNADEHYCFMALTFAKMPIVDMPRDSFLLSLNAEEQSRVEALFRLIDTYLRIPIPQTHTAEQLIAALVSDLCTQYRNAPVPAMTRAQGLMNDFLSLLTVNGKMRHGIPYYADKLCVTPNYLSTTVVEQSGMTVMQWIDRASLMEAKVLLLHTDFPIADIAYQLGFTDATSFCRFFKRESGMTAREYRKQ